jgi:hypothetical protein
VTRRAHRPHVTSTPEYEDHEDTCPARRDANRPCACATSPVERYPAIHDELCEVLGLPVVNASRERIVDKVRSLIGSKTNPTDPFDRAVEEIINLNRSKRSDYAGASASPWQNFIDSAHQTGDVPGKSTEILIATKQARLRQLLFTGREVQNEAVRDSLLDRAVYSIIALAMYDEGLYG